MPRQIQGSQTDFSYGEVDVALKRADGHPARKGGLRQMANGRILNSGSLQNRSGRSALYPVTNSGKRTERFAIAAGLIFDIQFAAGRVKIINSAGTTVGNFTTQGNGAALPWASASDINSIVFAVSTFGKSIYICFSGMRPQIISFDGTATWSIADYNEMVTPGGQKRTPFYRITPQGITAQPSATTGAITVDFSDPIVVAGMVGTRIRFCGRQILLGSIVSTTRMNAQVMEPLPVGQTLTLSAGAVGTINLGDELISQSGGKGIVTSTPNQQTLTGTFPAGLTYGNLVTGLTSGATGLVVATDGFVPPKRITVSLNTGTVFVAENVNTAAGAGTITSAGGTSITVQILAVGGQLIVVNAADGIAGPSFKGTVNTVATLSPRAVSVWDDEVFNSYQGYPRSVFVDQFRLGFCDFPGVPGGISWSAINSPTDLYVGANPSDGMFELAPNKVQVYYVVAGPEGSEFVFTDRRIYYIPISETNPLRPGSVAFKLLSGDGAGRVQPRLAQEAIVYANAGLSSMMAIIATGAFLRPFNTKNLSEFHAHLFSNIQCIAVPSADGTFNERYAYVLNGDGSIAVGKYDTDTLPANNPVVGWGPWSGSGTVTWISAYAADVVFTSTYFGNGAVEILDDAQYLDAALSVNNLPASFVVGGKGPLWLIAPGQTVTLIDQVTRVMGTYAVDANGFIVPQFAGGEDLTLASLVAGQPWTMITEPFEPAAQPGVDMHQRMELRQISKFAAYVIHSTGFLFQSLFSSKQTKTSPVPGTAMIERRVPPWNVDDDPTKPPTQRETVEFWTPTGSSYDPRVAIIKDTPGTLQILEIAVEITI